MEKYCSNCGKALKENADICLNCGVMVNKPQPVTKTKVKVPGKGMSIAGMILGIISVILVLSEIDSLYYYDFLEAFSDTIVYIGVSVTGLVLSAVSRSKIKNGFNMTGLILGIISTSLVFIAFLSTISL